MIRKRIVLVLACLLVAALAVNVNAEAVASGECGESVTWVLTDDGTLTISGTGAMDDFEWYETLWDGRSDSITKVVIEEGVTYVGMYAFYKCANLAELSISNSVSEIGRDAFAYCTALAQVVIPNSVTKIGDYAFYDGDSLKDLTIGDSVTSIGSCAFLGCENLEQVFIPESVETIGDAAFYLCKKLTGIWVDESNPAYANDTYGVLFNKDKTTLIQCPGGYQGAYTISANVVNIVDDAFRTCAGLTAFSVEEGNEAYSSDSAGVLFNKSKKTLFMCPGGFEGAYTIPETVTSMYMYAFYECRELTGVVIPNSIKRIAGYIFYNCSALTNVSIGNAVEVIAADAFYGCSALTSITIPASVKTIDVAVFMYCDNLKTVYFEGDAPEMEDSTFWGVELTAYYPKDNSTWTADVMQNYGGTITWVPYYPMIAEGTCGENLAWILGKDGILTISGTGPMDDYNIVAGSNSAPWRNLASFVKAVVIEEGVTTIGTYAFLACENMTELTIADTVHTIKSEAFNYCGGLVEVQIHAGITTIEEDAFHRCGGLKRFVVAENNPNYCHDSYGVLYNKDKTDIIEVPGAIESCVIADSIVKIDPSEFFGLLQLTTVTIPESVEYIGYVAFRECEALTEIYFEGDMPGFDEDVFWGVTATAYYPAGNETWTAEMMAAMGSDGNITWEAYTLEPEPTPNYNGLTLVDGVWGYYEDGVLQTDFTDLVLYEGNFYYVQNGILSFDYTGLVLYMGNYYYVENSVLNWGYTGLTLYNGVWYYVQNGVLQWGYYGLVCHNGAWFYVENSAITFAYTGLVEYGGNWYYVEGSCINWGYSSLYLHNGTWYVIQGGQLIWGYYGLVCYNDLWFYAENSMITFTFTGLAEYEGILFYFEGSCLNWSYNGKATYNGVEYDVVNGMAFF